MSYVVNSVDSLHNAFVNFTKSLRIGPHQIFHFSSSSMTADKKDLIKLFTTKPAFQWIEIDGSAIIQESTSLIDAAKKLIGPNFKQSTLNQDVYQLHNNATYGIVINNFDPAKDSPEQNPVTMDTLESIFPNIKIVIIYLHKVIADGDKDSYAELIMNKVVKTFDEDTADTWSLITNGITIVDSDILTNNRNGVAAAVAAAGATGANISKVTDAAKTGASPAFQDAVDSATAGAANVNDALAAIKGLPLAEFSLSTYAKTIKLALEEARDINVCFIDGTSTMNALAAIEDIEKDKPYALLVYNYDLSSSILNREFNKMKAMAISERQNASGSAYAVCQFMIATPKITNTTAATTTYLAYQAK